MSAICLFALVLLMAIGHVAAANWSGWRLQISADNNQRHTAMVAFGTAGILGLSMLIANAGLLTKFDARPPYVLRFIMPYIMLTMILSRSSYGRRLAVGLPISLLVGFQSFRILVELLLHRYYLQGLLPVQMTFDGRNFDIPAGVTAIPLAWLATRGLAPRWALYAWNILGLGLLVNIVGIAVVSMPGPLRLFTNDPANSLIARWPYICLPTFLVTTALLGHLLLFRRLSQKEAQS